MIEEKVGLVISKFRGVPLDNSKGTPSTSIHQEYKSVPSAATDGSGSSIFVVVAATVNVASTSLWSVATPWVISGSNSFTSWFTGWDVIEITGNTDRTTAFVSMGSLLTSWYADGW